MHLRVTDGAPANLSYPYVDSQLEPGDAFDVDSEKGEALLDAHDYLEQVADLDEDEENTKRLEDFTYDELREQASEADIDGRSEMDKAELIDALGEE